MTKKQLKEVIEFCLNSIYQETDAGLCSLWLDAKKKEMITRKQSNNLSEYCKRMFYDYEDKGVCESYWLGDFNIKGSNNRIFVLVLMKQMLLDSGEFKEW